MASPIVRAIKDLYPEASVDWLADVDNVGILQANPLIDRVIAFDSGQWRRDYRQVKIFNYLRTSFQIRRELQSHSYDLVIILTAEKWWAQWFNVAPISIGLFPAQQSNKLSHFFTKSVYVPDSGYGHSTDHYLRVIETLGGKGPFDRRMIYEVSETDRTAAQSFLNDQISFDIRQKLVVLHPGTSQETKCWPTNYFAALADLIEDTNIVITGSEREKALAEQIQRHSQRPQRIVVATGRLKSIGQTAALVERADVVVTGDTSLLHIASAVGTKVIGIFGGTRPGINLPLFGSNDLIYDDSVPCAPCYRSKCQWTGSDRLKCLTSIVPEEVYCRLLKVW